MFATPDDASVRLWSPLKQITHAPALLPRPGSYLWLPEARRFVLFMLYTKAKQPDIPPPLLARLRAAVETIKTNYNR